MKRYEVVVQIFDRKTNTSKQTIADTDLTSTVNELLDVMDLVNQMQGRE